MKNYIFSLIFFFTFSFGSVCMVWSGDFKSAMKAYEKGDYTYAVKELKLLAKTGHSMAQHFLGEMFYKGKGFNQDYKVLTRIINLLLNGIPFLQNKVMKFPNTILELCIVLD